jgi:hypothetical protein
MRRCTDYAKRKHWYTGVAMTPTGKRHDVQRLYDARQFRSVCWHDYAEKCDSCPEETGYYVFFEPNVSLHRML